MFTLGINSVSNIVINSVGNGTCTSSRLYYQTEKIICGYMLIDIDGPNKCKYPYGHDVFALAITKEGLKPSNYTENRLDTDYWMEQVYWYGGASSQWIMDNNNMDYLMVDSDGNCPNGHKLGYAEGRYRSCKYFLQPVFVFYFEIGFILNQYLLKIVPIFVL